MSFRIQIWNVKQREFKIELLCLWDHIWFKNQYFLAISVKMTHDISLPSRQVISSSFWSAKNHEKMCQIDVISFQRVLKFQDLSEHWFIFTKKFWWTWKLKFDETYVLIFGRKSGNFIDFDLEKQFCKSYLALSNLLAKTCKICKISVSRKFTDSVALYQLSKCCESPFFICLNLEFSRIFPKLRISKQMSCKWLNLSQYCT